MNSFINDVPLGVTSSNAHRILIVKTDLEVKLGEPYNQCSESVDVSYRQINCIEICIYEQVKSKYNCSIPSYYEIKGFLNCVQDLNQLTIEFYSQCESGCVKECVSSKFSTRLTSNNVTSSTLFYFSVNDLSTLKITQIPKMTVFDFVANIGGTLGLFVGVSFLSFVELLELSIDLFFILFH